MSETTMDEIVNPVIQMVTNYTYVSAIAALAYDIMLHCDDEIKYIWKSAWSAPKGLYLAARYYPAIYLSVIASDIIRLNTSTKLCQEFWWYYGFGGLILIVPTVNIILSIRVSALYGHKRSLIAILSVIFASKKSLQATSIKASKYVCPTITLSGSCRRTHNHSLHNHPRR
ncbi:hypothetical protein BDN70DRAFT_882378 [Pholiota conissans]|uniref:DUF6533 domain-containing protein n=1 Tax=Pholiota conissans TaxID=109636 RepID=A0A9P5YXH3_9AGAR|nr:hypothetical protein BDN70DRAFT_882378 [Pholiota conissans]